MHVLNLPNYQFRLKKDGERTLIFDSIRRKFVVLTPEEWVRQNFIEFLNQELGYPKSLMGVEKGLQYNGMPNRSDLLVFSKSGEPLMLVECKQPDVSITQKVFDQIARYNAVFGVSYLAVTNGLQHYYCKIDVENRTYQFLETLPCFDEIGN